MYYKQLHPYVHTASVAAWIISARNYAAFYGTATHRDQGHGPGLSLVCSVGRKAGVQQTGLLASGRADCSGSQVVHQPPQISFFQQFLFSPIALLLLLRPELFKTREETK